MARQFRPEEIERSKQSIRFELESLKISANSIRERLETLEYEFRDKGARVYLHDEIATAEALVQLLQGVPIFEVFEDE